MQPTRIAFLGSRRSRSGSAIDRLDTANASRHHVDVSPRALVAAAVCLLAGATLAYAGRAGLALPFFLATSCLAGFTVLQLLRSTRHVPAAPVAADLIPMVQGMAALGPELHRTEYRDVVFRLVRARLAGKDGIS